MLCSHRLSHSRMFRCSKTGTRPVGSHRSPPPAPSHLANTSLPSVGLFRAFPEWSHDTWSPASGCSQPDVCGVHLSDRRALPFAFEPVVPGTEGVVVMGWYGGAGLRGSSPRTVPVLEPPSPTLWAETSSATVPTPKAQSHSPTSSNCARGTCSLYCL